MEQRSYVLVVSTQSPFGISWDFYVQRVFKKGAHTPGSKFEALVVSCNIKICDIGRGLWRVFKRHTQQHQKGGSATHIATRDFPISQEPFEIVLDIFCSCDVTSVIIVTLHEFPRRRKLSKRELTTKLCVVKNF